MIKDLKDVREKLLGYRFDTVARFTSIDTARLRAIEEGEPPTFFELEALARVYGIDAELLAEEPITISPGDSVQLLTSLDEFKRVDDVTRARIVAAANAAKDLVTLRKLESDDDHRSQFIRERPRPPRITSRTPPYQQGADLARNVRLHLGLGNAPIRSLRDLVAKRFPSIAVLYANLGSEGPAGLSFVDSLRGPVIVLNYRGKNENPCVRRFSLAHELCHLLIDWTGQQPVAEISGYFNESALDRERRANAFAVRFLCPPQILQKLDLSNTTTLRSAFVRYGLHYTAWRLYLRNERNEELPKIPPPELTALGTEVQWIQAEVPAGLDDFPLSESPPERRTLIAQTAARLYSQRMIGRDEFAEMLGVTPAADLERVLDFFALDLPGRSISASV